MFYMPTHHSMPVMHKVRELLVTVAKDDLAGFKKVVFSEQKAEEQFELLFSRFFVVKTELASFGPNNNLVGKEPPSYSIFNHIIMSQARKIYDYIRTLPKFYDFFYYLKLSDTSGNSLLHTAIYEQDQPEVIEEYCNISRYLQEHLSREPIIALVNAQAMTPLNIVNENKAPRVNSALFARYKTILMQEWKQTQKRVLLGVGRKPGIRHLHDAIKSLSSFCFGVKFIIIKT